MIELHPAVQHMAEKEDMSFEERSVVGLMRVTIQHAVDNQALIKKWLQEINPLKLRGQALSDWALEVSSWVLPSHLRRIHAVETWKQPESNQAEHQGGDSSRKAEEASSSDSPKQGWENPFA